MRALLNGDSHRTYVEDCRELGIDDADYVGQPYPHPYIDIWLECKRHANQQGVPLLPEPEKGVLDQDAELMLAFEVLEEFAHLQQEETERRAKLKETMKTLSMPFAPDPMT